ncbi:MAG: EVE domain-containing protein [Bacteroidota bacterium]|nr:EVE domain-containing protein [Bacteroidota bacterium]
MNYWLLKTEKDTYSFDDLVGEGEGTWDGVRNYQARNNLRDMKLGDQIFIYHSVNDKEIVGLAELTQESFPDPTIDDDRWLAIKLKAIRPLENPVKLASVKSHPDLQSLLLVNHTRLSVMPIDKNSYHIIMEMSESPNENAR